MSTNKPFIRVDHLSREVDGRQIVNDISFSVSPGEVVAITGPSGSGKSSLLRLLNRLDEPTGGTVFLENQDYREIPPRDLRRRLGMVLQNPYLFSGTVAHNLSFGSWIRGKTLDTAVVAEWLGKVGLAGYEDRDVSHLSGGEAQRVSIARTLVNDPEILLLDEPTSALDQESKVDIENLVCNLLRSQNRTCLIVTHDAAQAARLTRRTITIDKGRLIEDRI